MRFQRAPSQPGRPSTAQRRAERPQAQVSAAPLPRFSIGNLAVKPAALPEGLKSGIEALSGVSMEGVRVCYNSPHPARLDALAFARGRDIHLAAGQDRHLPHEAWHLVQQARGKVRPTARLGGVSINEDDGLEREADRMGAKALRHAQPASRPARAALSRPALPQILPARSSSSPVQGPGSAAAAGGDGSSGIAQLGGGKGKKKKEKERQKRLAAIDRLERGRPETYSHLDPKTAKALVKLEQMQPRKTAARKNIERFKSQPPDLPSVVEAGAGEGRFSGAFSKKFGRKYVATDIASSEGPHGFLSLAKRHRVGRKFGVDANDLGSHFLPNSLRRVVAANPFGVKGTRGASFGLQSENPGGRGKNRYLPDKRFLQGARPLLKPGGSVEIYGRSNILRDQAVAKVPSTGPKGRRTQHEQALVKAAKEKFSGENANPYLAIDPEGLRNLAKATRYRVNVKRAKQPGGIGKGGNPDTKSGDKDRAQKGLKPFNTRFRFTPAESGYESDDDDPRVVYDSGDESDWED